MLRAENLMKTYGRKAAVRSVTLEVRPGEVIGLLGRNGAGKTTIFQMIAGLLRPDSGRILINGQDVSARPTDRRARLGLTYLPQEHSVFLKASVADNLRLSLELQPYGRGEQEDMARRLLEEMGLAPLAGQKAYSLSGGERRRLEICRALTLKPSFLLLDEPFTGIDPLTIIDLQAILDLLKGRGIGILVSDHNVRDTFHVADRAYIIDEGEILVEGPPAAITADPRARERFLGQDYEPGP
ncbi:MAG: LPS export ABC transporter ATP-binding protein [Candidatus Aminicenantes bacterium RBG_13_62_12]|nr:MAG: LPS export ABC transporter ATP-binding protein [Candidatus Aminicenantes bacterium RBG_13_62_12]